MDYKPVDYVDNLFAFMVTQPVSSLREELVECLDDYERFRLEDYAGVHEGLAALENTKGLFYVGMHYTIVEAAIAENEGRVGDCELWLLMARCYQEDSSRMDAMIDLIIPQYFRSQ